MKTLAIKQLRQAAWSHVRGFKKTEWGAIGYIALVSFGFFSLSFLLRYFLPHTPALRLIELLLEFVAWCVIIPLTAGNLLLGLRRYRGEPTDAMMVFNGFRKPMVYPLLIAGVFNNVINSFCVVALMSVLHHAPHSATPFGSLLSLAMIIVLILFLIQLWFIIQFTMLLVLDKQLRPWDAITAAYNGVLTHFWRFVLLALFLLCLQLAGIFTLFIGTVWFYPLALLMVVGAYRQVFEVKAA